MELMENSFRYKTRNKFVLYSGVLVLRFVICIAQNFKGKGLRSNHSDFRFQKSVFRLLSSDLCFWYGNCFL